MINKIKGVIKISYLPYFLFLSALVIATIIIFYQSDKNILSNISNNSALYLLSAMAQALAAILAIVIGFSFVAVQLSAQIGSPRVFDLILKGRALWLLLVLYGFSIIYDLLLLRILPEKNIDNIFLVNSINLSIFLTFISFISLFPYAYNTIERLKPEKIIQAIIKINSDNEEALKRDVILPIVDIMDKAINANDPHTLKVGLDELEKLNVDIINSKIDKSEYKLEIVKYYSGKISRLVENAFNQNDEDSVIEITESLKNIGIISIKMRWSEVPPDETERIKSNGIYKSVGIPGKTDNYDNIASEVKNILNYVFIKAIGKKWSRATRSTLNVRGSLMATSRKELVDIFYDIFQISNDFSRLSNEEKIFSMDYFMEATRDIILEMINKDIHFNDRNFITVIKDILNDSLQVINKEEYFKLSQNIDYITDIGIEAAKKNHKLKDDIKECFGIIADSGKLLATPIFELGNRGYGLALESKKAETIWICSCLEYIGILYLSKKMDEPTNDIFSFLGGIENNYRHTKSSDVLEITEKTIEIIEELGYKSIEYICEKSSKEAILALIDIGMMNENTTIKTRICNTLNDMQKKLENKDIFKSVIEINEKKQEYELAKFHEFKKFCAFDTGKHSR
ncbi:MAG: hypothetical protein OIN89_07775 [Candidatus Methanoperedens sp.]|nr:hypothetical protein [Candidatus Methanoperedens sp.]